MAADLSKIRNIGIIAHIDAGKTTTTDHVLYYAGAKHTLGYVDKGTTETDYDPEEQERGITIYSACIPFKWRDCTVNLIDTPGHVDFTAEVERSLRVLDGCVVVFDAQKGVEAQSETVWRQADKYSVPRLAFINKMDVVGANFANAVEEIRDRLEGNPVPVTIPIGSGSEKDSETPFAGVIDLIEMKALYFSERDDGKTIRVQPIPEASQLEAQDYRDRLIDVLTQHDPDDRITSAALEGKNIPADGIRQLLREQTLKRLVQPVLCGSGREHMGIQPLMDAVTYYLPSPLDRPPVVGTNPKKKDKEESRKPDPKEPFSGLVFKVTADKHGEVSFVRIYSGTIKPQSRLLNPRTDKKELISKIHHVYADPTKRANLEELAGGSQTGDIVVLVSLKESITGDTLCDPQHPILLEPIRFAMAVVSQSVEPQSSADKDKLVATLDTLKREDPTFDWRVDRDTGQTLMSGMGVLHLEIKQHRMERDFALKVRVGKPLVSYRETIQRSVEITGEFDKQAGAASLFARVKVKFRPAEAPVPTVSGFVPEGMPSEFFAAAVEGIQGAFKSGDIGYPIINVAAEITGFELDEAMSNEVAFQAAGADAVNRAIKNNAVLLWPVMRLEVTVPEEYLGVVNSDLNARRATIEGTAIRGKLRVVEATVPLERMFDYSEKVRSLTQGRASWSMEPREYAPAPEEVRRRLLGLDQDY